MEWPDDVYFAHVPWSISKIATTVAVLVWICEMFLLIRRCKFDGHWRYLKLVGRMRFHELHARSLTNLFWRNFCSAKPNTLDNRTRRFLDYLANEYKNKSWRSNSFVDFDLNASGGLLSERAQLVENIQNLQDLGKQGMLVITITGIICNDSQR